MTLESFFHITSKCRRACIRQFEGIFLPANNDCTLSFLQEPSSLCFFFSGLVGLAMLLALASLLSDPASQPPKPLCRDFLTPPWFLIEGAGPALLTFSLSPFFLPKPPLWYLLSSAFLVTCSLYGPNKPLEIGIHRYLSAYLSRCRFLRIVCGLFFPFRNEFFPDSF